MTGHVWSGPVPDDFGVQATITDTDTVIDVRQAHRRDGQVVVTGTINQPGLYRVRIDGGNAPSRAVPAGDAVSEPIDVFPI